MTEESRKDPLFNFSETPEVRLLLDLAKGEGRSLPSNIAGLDRIQTQLDQQVALLAELDAEIAQVVGRLDQTSSYQTTSYQTTSLLAKRDAKVDRLKKLTVQLKQKIAERDAKVKMLKAQLSAIQASSSWRATAPLRSISAGLKRLAHTIRRAFTHEGGRHPIRSERHWRLGQLVQVHIVRNGKQDGPEAGGTLAELVIHLGSRTVHERP